MNKQQIAILDFRTATVYIRDIPDSMTNDDIEDITAYFENKLKLHINDCQYMVFTNPINIK